MAGAVEADYRLSTEAKLDAFVRAILEAVGVPPPDAAIVAAALTAADLAGTESHGVARLQSYDVLHLRDGSIAAAPHPVTVHETPVSIVVDAGNGLGHPVAKRTMDAVIAKARASHVAFGTVRGSNHFGTAGYYAALALPHDMIGIAATTSIRSAAPTFGKELMLGTNPWAYAVPAGTEPPFVLDFATTTVARGTIETALRTGRPLLPGWAIDANGVETLSPADALTGALLPLGGLGKDNGGHKGYGLGLLVDILCGVLSGGAFGSAIPAANGPERAGTISHFFGAIRIDGFRDVDAFKADMDRELRGFKTSRRGPGFDRLYVAGEPEWEATERHRANGVPVHARVWASLEQLAAELGVPFDLAR